MEGKCGFNAALLFEKCGVSWPNDGSIVLIRYVNRRLPCSRIKTSVFPVVVCSLISNTVTPSFSRCCTLFIYTQSTVLIWGPSPSNSTDHTHTCSHTHRQRHKKGKELNEKKRNSIHPSPQSRWPLWVCVSPGGSLCRGMGNLNQQLR